MAKDSAIVSADIGRDVEIQAPDASKVYVGEVNQLRVRFNGMLQDFQTTRNESQRALRPNPFFDSVALPAASLQDPLQEIAKELIVATPVGKRAISQRAVYVEPPPVTPCNQLKTVLRVCVMGPTCAGLILVVVIVAVILLARPCFPVFFCNKGDLRFNSICEQLNGLSP